MKKIIVVMMGILIMNFVTINVLAGNQKGGFLSANQNYYVECNKSYITLKTAKAAINRWDIASDHVSLIYKGSKANGKNGINISVGKLKPPKEGNLGLTAYSYKGESVSSSQRRDRAFCIVYANSNFSKNSNAIQATLMHEVGHALSLTHTDGAKDIMHQAVKDYKKLSKADKKWLRKKWGN